eukprot:9198273-Alexandrium_andersonii.AAC.1
MKTLSFDEPVSANIVAAILGKPYVNPSVTATGILSITDLASLVQTWRLFPLHERDEEGHRPPTTWSRRRSS